MENKTLLIGGGVGAVVVGLLLGWALDGSDGKLRQELDEMRKATAQLSDQVKSIEGGAGETAAKIAQITTGQEGLTTQLSEMKDNIAASADSLRADIANSTTALRDELNAQIGAASSAAEDLRAQVAGLAAGMAQPEPTEPAEPKDEAAPVELVETPSEEATDGGAVLAGPGHTAVLSDGLRIFLARVDAEGGEAMAAVNGLTSRRFRSGQPVAIASGNDLCTVTLSDVTGAGARFAHACGDAVEAPKGTRVGETTRLGDDVRVFVARLDTSEGSAKLAVNGLATRTIDYDNSVSVSTSKGRCDLVLDNIDRGHAALSLACPE